MSNSIFIGMSLERETFTCVDRVAACNNLIVDDIIRKLCLSEYLHEHIEISEGELETDGLGYVNGHRLFIRLKQSHQKHKDDLVMIPQSQFAIVLCFRIPGYHSHYINWLLDDFMQIFVCLTNLNWTLSLRAAMVTVSPNCVRSRMILWSSWLGSCKLCVIIRMSRQS